MFFDMGPFEVLVNTALGMAVFTFRGEGVTLRVLLATGADPEPGNAHSRCPAGLTGRASV
ncbi:hypothetical protein [Streptomyces sp. NPDC001070]